MKIIEVKDQIEGGKVAFDILKETLKKGAQTLGLATGSSPLEFYKQIRESDLDLSNLISVNLDEYVGLTGDDPQSYRYFMEKNLFDAKPFKESYLPSGVEESADQEVIRYNSKSIQWTFKSWVLGAMGISVLMSQGHPLIVRPT